MLASLGALSLVSGSILLVDAPPADATPLTVPFCEDGEYRPSRDATAPLKCIPLYTGGVGDKDNMEPRVFHLETPADEPFPADFRIAPLSSDLPEHWRILARGGVIAASVTVEGAASQVPYLTPGSFLWQNQMVAGSTLPGAVLQSNMDGFVNERVSDTRYDIALRRLDFPREVVLGTPPADLKSRCDAGVGSDSGAAGAWVRFSYHPVTYRFSKADGGVAWEWSTTISPPDNWVWIGPSRGVCWSDSTTDEMFTAPAGSINSTLGPFNDAHHDAGMPAFRGAGYAELTLARSPVRALGPTFGGPEAFPTDGLDVGVDVGTFFVHEIPVTSPSPLDADPLVTMTPAIDEDGLYRTLGIAATWDPDASRIVIFGTPSYSGVFPLEVSASSTVGGETRVGTAVYTLVVHGPPRTSGSEELPDAVAGQEYGALIGPADGHPVPEWSVPASTLLPDGILFSENGLLYGTPTAPGSSTLVFELANARDTVAVTRTLRVLPPAPVFSSSPLPTATRELPLTDASVAATSPYPLDYEIVAGSLPSGVTLEEDGSLTGTPTTSGESEFTVRATTTAAGLQNATEQTFTLAVAPPAAEFVSSPPEAATKGVSYTHTFATSTPARFSVSDGDLPAGLTLSEEGVLTGTPTEAGIALFTVTATRTENGVSATREQEVSLSVVVAQPDFPAATLPRATRDQEYEATLTATGDPAPTFELVAPSTLPPGLELSADGVLSGHPTTSGSHVFTVRATSSENGSSAAAERELTLEVAPPAPALSTSPPPDGRAGSAYTASFSAVSTPPAVFSVVDGELPPGLVLAPDGALTGTPSAAGVYGFEVRATATEGGLSSWAEHPFEIVVDPAFPVFITAPGLPPAMRGVSYAAWIAADADTAATFAVTTGALPAGVTLGPGGLLSGTPTGLDDAVFTVTATTIENGRTASVEREFSLAVNPQTPVFTTTALPHAVVGSGYSTAISASGVPAATFALITGSLPSGLTLGADGTLRGTPTAAGTAAFTIRATIADGDETATATRAFSLRVQPAPGRPLAAPSAPPGAGGADGGETTPTPTATPAPGTDEPGGSDDPDRPDTSDDPVDDAPASATDDGTGLLWLWLIAAALAVAGVVGGAVFTRRPRG